MRLSRFGKRINQPGGQSFVELALILPLILIMFVGMIEVGFYVFNYLNALDLTREAARFASVRDYKVATSGTASLAECANDSLDYFKDTACFFIDPGLNPNTPLDPNKYDDMTISVFSIISDTNSVDIERWPKPPIDTNNDGIWSLYNDNWLRDCQGNIVRSEPYFRDADLPALLQQSAPSSKGVVLVEAHICYEQMIYIPLISEFIGSPFRIHTYTFMPAPEAIPTPTPIP
jgi:hypothetical protein